MATSPSEKRVVIPDDFPLVFTDSAALARLRRMPEFDVRTFTTRPANSDELVDRIKGAHTVVLTRTTTRMTNTVLESATPDLRHMAIWGTAVDHIALEAARRLGITVSNTPNTATVAVAEHALAMLLSLARKIPQLDRRLRAGEWPGGQLTQLAGKTLGIVGTGAVGVRMARLAEGIGMRVQTSSLTDTPTNDQESNVAEVSFDQLLGTSDAISLHARLTPRTR
ncbi:MAG: NAD(P)-dependent oxidoreductase, partial [Chloroflexota bacterium]